MVGDTVVASIQICAWFYFTLSV